MIWLVAVLVGAALALVGVSLVIRNTASTITVKPDPRIAELADAQKAAAEKAAAEQELKVREASREDLLDRLNRM